MKIVLAPDSFKGTMSAEEVCQIERETIEKIYPDAETVSVPMADGGEGMVDAYLRILGGEKVGIRVTGPEGRPVDAYYGILPSGSAVIEMAQAAGLTLMRKKNPLRATTFGLGELILDAKNRGIRDIILGLGGSATNDCGIGMALALGFKFLDDTGCEFKPCATELADISDVIYPTGLRLNITAACDVDNPLLGKSGATYTFGPQKGAGEKELEILEAGMKSFAEVLVKKTGKSIDVPGAGAAGGLGAAVISMLSGRLIPGCELLLDEAGFDEIIADADLVITGEGRIDSQSAHGKVPSAVGGRCKGKNIPCIAVCGLRGEGFESIHDCGIDRVYASSDEERPLEEVLKTCREDLAKTVEEAIKHIIDGNEKPMYYEDTKATSSRVSQNLLLARNSDAKIHQL